MAIQDDSDRALVSMGVYVFSIDLLVKMLVEDAANDHSTHDFGADIIPQVINDQLVSAYYFGGRKGRVTPDYYWRDVGTIDSYYEANMDLLEHTPPLNLYQPGWPIRSYQTQSPPLRAVRGASGGEGVFINSLAAGGVIIAGGEVYRSILFSGVFIDDLAMVRNVILFEGVHVGANVKLQNCIVDKNVEIPEGESIGFDMEKDASRFLISENGIVMVPKNYSFGIIIQHNLEP